MLPAICYWADPVWHLFVVRSERRDKLQAHLKNRGVNALVHYPVPPHLQEAYPQLELSETFPITEAIHRQVLSLPMGPHLKEPDVQRTIEEVKSFAD